MVHKARTVHGRVDACRAVPCAAPLRRAPGRVSLLGVKPLRPDVTGGTYIYFTHVGVVRQIVKKARTPTRSTRVAHANVALVLGVRD